MRLRNDLHNLADVEASAQQTIVHSGARRALSKSYMQHPLITYYTHAIDTSVPNLFCVITSSHNLRIATYQRALVRTNERLELSARLGLEEALLSLVEVDDVPDGVQVLHTPTRIQCSVLTRAEVEELKGHTSALTFKYCR